MPYRMYDLSNKSPRKMASYHHNGNHNEPTRNHTVLSAKSTVAIVKSESTKRGTMAPFDSALAVSSTEEVEGVELGKESPTTLGASSAMARHGYVTPSNIRQARNFEIVLWHRCPCYDGWLPSSSQQNLLPT